MLLRQICIYIIIESFKYNSHESRKVNYFALFLSNSCYLKSTSLIVPATSSSINSDLVSGFMQCPGGTTKSFVDINFLLNYIGKCPENSSLTL